MPILHVRNVPRELYERIRRRAGAERRSISAEVVVLLQRSLEQPHPEVAQLLADLRRRRSFTPRKVGAPESTRLLRQARQR